MAATLSRSLHDVSLAAWFGGSLMGAVGLNGAAAQAEQPSERVRLATVGWRRWAPISALAMGTNLVAGAALLAENQGRVASQAGVARNAEVKTLLTGGAVITTAYAGWLSRGLRRKVAAEGPTEPSAETPPKVARRQRRLRLVQWLTPVLLGTVVVINAQMGEQQRPRNIVSGVVDRVLPG